MATYQYNLINDKCCFPIENKKIENYNIFSKLYSQMKKNLFFEKKLDAFFPIFDPLSKFRLLLDICNFFLTGILFVLIPLDISFNSKFEIIDKEDFKLKSMKKISLVFFVCDILINFNTGIYEKGIFVSNRRIIGKKYLKNLFFFDFISLFFFIFELFHWEQKIILKETLLKWASILFYLRTRNFYTILSKIGETFFVGNLLNNLFSLIKLFGFTILVSHFFSCLWYSIAEIQLNSSEHTWLHQKNLLMAPWWKKFLYKKYYLNYN